jgi:hypothetical protein
MAVAEFDVSGNLEQIIFQEQEVSPVFIVPDERFDRHTISLDVS